MLFICFYGFDRTKWHLMSGQKLICRSSWLALEIAYYWPCRHVYNNISKNRESVCDFYLGSFFTLFLLFYLLFVTETPWRSRTWPLSWFPTEISVCHMKALYHWYVRIFLFITENFRFLMNDKAWNKVVLYFMLFKGI